MILVRLPLFIPLIAIDLLAKLLILAGQWGEVISEWVDDIRHSIWTLTSPRIWSYHERLRSENANLEARCKYAWDAKDRLAEELERLEGRSDSMHRELTGEDHSTINPTPASGEVGK